MRVQDNGEDVPNEATRGPNEAMSGTPPTSERRAKRGHPGLISNARLRVNQTKRGQMRPIFENFAPGPIASIYGRMIGNEWK